MLDKMLYRVFRVRCDRPAGWYFC